LYCTTIIVLTASRVRAGTTGRGENGAKRNQTVALWGQTGTNGGTISETDGFDDLEREVEKRMAEHRAEPRDIHAGDCTCDACYLDAERIARMEEERRQWE
jgi:hypothetical protein